MKEFRAGTALDKRGADFPVDGGLVVLGRPEPILCPHRSQESTQSIESNESTDLTKTGMT